MVPMHDFTTEEALHEPKRERASSPRPSPPREERETLSTVSGFMVPMHAAGRKGALHEPKRKIPLTPTLSPGEREKRSEGSRFMATMHATGAEGGYGPEATTSLP